MLLHHLVTLYARHCLPLTFFISKICWHEATFVEWAALGRLLERDLSKEEASRFTGLKQVSCRRSEKDFLKMLISTAGRPQDILDYSCMIESQYRLSSGRSRSYMTYQLSIMHYAFNYLLVKIVPH